jgi:lipid-binding SYLF domain-containing protein
MKKGNHKISMGTFVFMAILMISSANFTATAAEVSEEQILVDKALLTFQSMIADDDMTWLRENLPGAKGILIIPKLLKAGFIFGGSGGSGVLILRDEKTGQWSQPGFYTIGSVTFGLQIGGEAAEVVMLLKNQRAVEKMMSSDFKLGADTSVAAGPVGAGAKTNIVADLYSFTRAKGLYGGVSLEGSVIKIRDSWNANYYGKSVRPIDIFVKKTVSNPGSTKLREAVEKAARK